MVVAVVVVVAVVAFPADVTVCCQRNIYGETLVAIRPCCPHTDSGILHVLYDTVKFVSS